MGQVAYFFDTYALFEILRGNAAYDRFQADGFITTKLNLLEFHYRALELYGERFADTTFQKLLPNTIVIPDAVLLRASKLKRREKKRRLSYVDCIGYELAQTNALPFLTGDKEFRDMPGVEFVR
jgi:predicted nucleic acid-binding protein